MLAVAGLAAVAVAAPVTAYAGHAAFTDGPYGAHEAGIHWLSDSGVTKGCNPEGTRYCPGDPVTRAQMATFMHRLSGNAPGIAPKVNAATLGGLEPTQLAPFAIATGATAESGATTTSQPLPGASVQVSVPAGRTGIVVASFTAESACTGSSGYCSMRILVNGVNAKPFDEGSDIDFAFDSTDNGTETAASWESHAMTRSTAALPAGTYTVTVDRRLVGATSFRLDDWHLMAEVKLVS